MLQIYFHGKNQELRWYDANGDGNEANQTITMTTIVLVISCYHFISLCDVR